MAIQHLRVIVVSHDVLCMNCDPLRWCHSGSHDLSADCCWIDPDAWIGSLSPKKVKNQARQTRGVTLAPLWTLKPKPGLCMSFTSKKNHFLFVFLLSPCTGKALWNKRFFLLMSNYISSWWCVMVISTQGKPRSCSQSHTNQWQH